jgi:pilus assembly protein Flp/PilA
MGVLFHDRGTIVIQPDSCDNGSKLKLKLTSMKGDKRMYLPREEGQGLVEYALILVLVAIVVIAILALLGPQIANIFSKVTSGLTGT